MLSFPVSQRTHSLILWFFESKLALEALMEVQNPGRQKDHQVIIHIDQLNNKIKQSSQAGPSSDPVSQTKSPRRLYLSKPKARFAERNYPVSPKTTIENENSSSDEDEDGDHDWYENHEEGNEDNAHHKYRTKRRERKVNKRAIIEWTLFILIMTSLICSLTKKSIKEKVKFGQKLWKWCVMVSVIFCGRLVSGWVVQFVVFLIERNFMLREKVVYFVYGLRKSFQHCAWLALVLIAWLIMFPNVHKRNKVVKKVFRALIVVLIGAIVWLLKIVAVKVLASSFHVSTFFERMKESVFHHYVLDTLSWPPQDEAQRELRQGAALQESRSWPTTLRDESRRIDMQKMKRLSMDSRRNPSAWSVKRLVSYVMSSGLSTMSRSVDDFSNAESEINSEWEARNCAKRIFNNVAKLDTKYIEEEDLLKFLKSEEVYTIFPHFEGAVKTGRITKSAFRNWVVHAYIERKALAHSLNDTKSAVKQLHKLASAIVIVIMVVVSLLVMGVATSKVLFVVTSQLLLVGFMFQNTCKTIFESIIFVFVMHPFDVGDLCVVDGNQMVVEEMHILTTVFLRLDMEKVYYPNSVLVTKPISNFRRSPQMGDAVDFTIDVSTPVDDINALKKAIRTYIESKPKYWSAKHDVIVKDIENMNKMNLCLCVQHTISHQDMGEMTNRKSELVFELKKIFDNHHIKYNLLPQEVHLTQVNPANIGRMPTQS